MVDPARIGHGAEQTVSRQGAPASSGEAEGKRDELRQAMREDVDKDKPEDEAAQAQREKNAKGEKGELPPPPFSGDALLRGLGASYAPLEAQPQGAASLAAELAERILVNTDSRAADGEVRITLKDSVLQDTEIILRQEGGRLVVQLMSGNPASLEALRLAQDDLRNKLMAPDRDIHVEVLDSRSREGGEGSGHSGARSRGLDYFSESES